MCKNRVAAADSPSNFGRGTHLHLRDIADRWHNTQGTPVSSMLAVSRQNVLWVQLRGFRLHLPPGVERFVLSPDNVWYGRLKLLFTISVKIDGQDEPVDIECAFVSFCYEIKLEPSGV